MRSGRHRILWLAVVVIALAVGVVVGSLALSGPLVSGLRGDKGSLQQQITALGDQNRALSEKLAAADKFDTEMAGRIVRDSLAGKSVVLLSTPDADVSDVEAISRLIGQAGGTVTGNVGLTDEFVHGNAAEKLQSVVNSPIVPAGAKLDTTLVDPSAQAGDLLGIALLINRDPTIARVDDAARDAVLAALRDTGFLTYGDRVGPANAAVIVTGGSLPDDAGNQGLTVARFTTALAPHGSGAVLAGRDGSATGVSAIAVARADAGPGGAVTTIDDIGRESGRITAVLALQTMISGTQPAVPQ